MRIWPILIDAAPEYLGPSDVLSLLSVPLGTTTVVEHLQATVARVTRNAPTILAPPRAGQGYVERMAGECPTLHVVLTSNELVEFFADWEMSDVLLIIDPLWLPVRRDEICALLRHFSGEQQVAHHLVALQRGVAGTKEQVDLDATGHIRRIHRHYELSTWPFVAGVAASLVPISSVVLTDGHLPASPAELRQQLMSRGVSSRDVPIESGVFALRHEQGLLSASEQFLLSAAPSEGAVMVRSGQRVDSTARLIGPVAIHANAVIEGHVTVVGPAVIGPGARVQAGAVVAHALIGADCTVAAGGVVRDRACFLNTCVARDRTESRISSFGERLARLSYDLQDRAIRADTDTRPLFQMRVKRLADPVIAAVGLLLLSPLLALVGAIVKLDSKGSMFYGSEREGVGGRVFKCWKFRTMRIDADAAQHRLGDVDTVDGPHFKVDLDPRVTRIGRILRATNLDELPQLFNVLRGDMSLVGPRPSPFRENQICVPWREARLSVRPGITGLWQICRRDRSSGDFHQWIEYDLLYVQHMSLLVDLKILVMTFLTLGGLVPVPSSWIIPAHASKPDVWIDSHADVSRDATESGVWRTGSAAGREPVESRHGAPVRST